MARPTGNTTGLSIFAGELDGKRQEILIEAVRGLRRMAALANVNATPVAKLDVLREAARARDIELSIHQVAAGEEIAAAIDLVQEGKCGASVPRNFRSAALPNRCLIGPSIVIFPAN